MSVTVGPLTATLSARIGDTLRLTARVTDQYGQALTVPSRGPSGSARRGGGGFGRLALVTARSNGTAVVTASAGGVGRGSGSGTVTVVTATAGGVSGSATVTVAQPPGRDRDPDLHQQRATGVRTREGTLRDFLRGHLTRKESPWNQTRVIRCRLARFTVPARTTTDSQQGAGTSTQPTVAEREVCDDRRYQGCCKRIRRALDRSLRARPGGRAGRRLGPGSTGRGGRGHDVGDARHPGVGRLDVRAPPSGWPWEGTRGSARHGSRPRVSGSVSA